MFALLRRQVTRELSRTWKLADIPLRALGWLLGDIARFHRATKVAAPFGRALMRGLVAAERGGDRPSFAIPLELEERWSLADG